MSDMCQPRCCGGTVPSTFNSNNKLCPHCQEKLYFLSTYTEKTCSLKDQIKTVVDFLGLVAYISFIFFKPCCTKVKVHGPQFAYPSSRAKVLRHLNSRKLVFKRDLMFTTVIKINPGVEAGTLLVVLGPHLLCFIFWVSQSPEETTGILRALGNTAQISGYLCTRESQELLGQ